MTQSPSLPQGDSNSEFELDARQVIVSPEQVALHLPITGPTTRMLAYGIDCTLILVLETALLLMLLAATPLVEFVAGPVRDLLAQLGSGDPSQIELGGAVLVVLAVFFLIQFTVEWSYFVVSELLSGGRSLGKAVVGLRVVRDGGLPITVSASLVRNLLRMVDMLPGTYVVGLTAIVVSQQGKRLGDLAAGTVVVRLDKPPPAADLTALGDQEVARFRFERSQIERLGVTERALVRQTLRRVQSLPQGQGDEILATAVHALCQRLDYAAVESGERRAFLEALLRAMQRR